MGIFVTPEERILDLEHENRELKEELSAARSELAFMKALDHPEMLIDEEE